MRKFLIIAELRALEKQVALGEISYSKMVELLNEKAEAWYKEKINNSFYCHDECIANASEDYEFKKCETQCDKCK